MKVIKKATSTKIELKILKKQIERLIMLEQVV
jgi:hypothetical protein